MRVAQRGPRPGRRPGSRWNSFAFFGDPGGNLWAIQERPAE
jgi:hypothetical protein